MAKEKPELKAGNKDEVFWKVLNAALELDIKKGHLKWTFSDLSRRSGITRSLIYYYFGPSKVAILDAAILVIGEELVGLTPGRLQMWKDGLHIESMVEARSLFEKAPFIPIFIMIHQQAATPMGEALRKIETDFLNKIKAFHPTLQSDTIRAIYAIYFGCTFAPGVDRGAIQQVIRAIQSFAPNSSNG